MCLTANKWMWAVALCIGFIAPSLSARDVELSLNDGRKLRGTLVSERPDSITLRVSGVESTYQRARIKTMVTVLSLEDEFKADRAKLKDDDFTGRFKLARAMYNKKTRDADLIALAEVESILKDNPGHPLSVALKSALESRVKAAPKPAAEPSKPTTPTKTTPAKPATAPSTSTPAKSTTKGLPSLLDKGDINLMKVYEVNLDNNPRVIVSRKLVDKILDEQQDNEAMKAYAGRDGERAFRNLKPIEVLDTLFAIGDRDLYKEVLISNEPDTLKYFRTKINTSYVIGYCGKCHGHPRTAAPGLSLYTQRTESATYTNLAWLRLLENIDGVPMIFTPTPNRSPLFQYGLPSEYADTAHPEVPRYRPYFKNAEDPRYLDYLKWVDLLWPKNETYPVNIKMP